jgi:cobalt-zinc-cadmium efflux system protein
MNEHTHDHAPKSFGKIFAIGILLNFGFVLIEAWGGWRSDSLALIADAGHNLSDVGGMLLAWVAYAVSKLKPNSTHTFGWRKASVLAGFANALMLIFGMGSLAWEAAHRFQHPEAVDSVTVMLISGVGIMINGFTAWMFSKGSQKDSNIRGAFLHMASDALVSAGVLIAGGLTLWKGWLWMDPLISLVIAFLIILSTWSLLKNSLHQLFDGVPPDVNLDEVRLALLALPNVQSIHSLHVWSISTSEIALTAHLVLDRQAGTNDELLSAAEKILHEGFEITNVTLQIESQTYIQTCSALTSCTS